MEKRIRLKISYDGTAYHGWQIQKNAVSVAATLERAVGMVVGHPAHVTGCRLSSKIGKIRPEIRARRFVFFMFAWYISKMHGRGSRCGRVVAGVFACTPHRRLLYLEPFPGRGGVLRGHFRGMNG